MSKIIRKIAHNEDYENMVKDRNKVSFIFLSIVVFLYFGFIFTLAFNKTFFYQQINGSVITYGVPIGVSVILLTVFLTIIYGTIVSKQIDVKRAQILKEIKDEESK